MNCTIVLATVIGADVLESNMIFEKGRMILPGHQRSDPGSCPPCRRKSSTLLINTFDEGTKVPSTRSLSLRWDFAVTITFALCFTQK